MPKVAIELGSVDYVCALSSVPGKILDLVEKDADDYSVNTHASL
jgi:chemotaxis response regulator CheB